MSSIRRKVVNQDEYEYVGYGGEYDYEEYEYDYEEYEYEEYEGRGYEYMSMRAQEESEGQGITARVGSEQPHLQHQRPAIIGLGSG